jgi:hypothetical protein
MGFRPDGTNSRFPQTSMVTGYHVIGHFDIPGSGSENWEDAAIDSEARRLYLSHGDRLEVLNADSGRVVGVIPGMEEARGLEIVSEFSRGFVSNCGKGSVSIFDTNTLKVVKKVGTTEKCPDGILYDEFTKRVFVMPKGGKVSVLDARTGDQVGIVDIHGYPESSVSDGAGKVYVTVFYDKPGGAVVVIDAKTLAITRTYADVCSQPKSLLYNGSNRRLFVGCMGGFVALDAVTGDWVGKSIMCGGVDGGAFDPDSRLIFESCGEGVISILQEVASAPYYRLIETVPTRLWARTMAFDLKTKRIYLPVGILEYEPTSGPSARLHTKPGSFNVVIVGKN